MGTPKGREKSMARSSISALAAAALLMSLTGCAGSSGGDNKVITAESSDVSDDGGAETRETADGTPDDGFVTEGSDTERREAAFDKTGVPVGVKVGIDLALLDRDEEKNMWTTHDEDLQKFVNVMERECTRSDDQSGAYLLATDDKVLFFGGINAEDRDGNKIDPFTTYELGSVTKTFTATCILQLEEQGKLGIGDKLDKWFPELNGAENVSIGELLCMRSGLRREFFEDSVIGDEKTGDIEVFKRYYTDGYTDAELIGALNSGSTPAFGDKDIVYSNAGYTLLAMIVEKVSGQSYADYVQQNIFDVCGMEHSSSMKTGDVTSVPVSPPEGAYLFDFEAIFPDGYSKDPNISRGAGDIHSCAADLLAFDRALVGGKLLGEDSLKKMFTMNKNIPYCCGWMLYGSWQPQTENDSVKAYYHNGATPSYYSMNMYTKSEKYGNIYLIELSSNIAAAERLDTCVNSIVFSAKI